MATIIIILTDGYADWEIGLLAATARSFYGLEIRHASPGAAPVTSAGGLRVTPDLAVEDIDPDTLDALVVCGGSAWRRPDAPALSGLLKRSYAGGAVIGGICDGTRMLAQAGLLDEVGHTSNSPETLLETGYAGRANYWDVPHAVLTERIVTAPGTAPTSFMAAIIEGLGLADLNLDFYLGLLAAEHGDRIAAMPPGHPAAMAAGRSKESPARP
jgi:putative intracellular protease/amidase